MASIIIYGFVVGVYLWGGDKRGKKLAERYLKVRFSTFICADILSYAFLYKYADLHDQLTEMTIESVVSEFVFFVVWLAYFQNSKRVENTFPDNDYSSSDNQIDKEKLLIDQDSSTGETNKSRTLHININGSLIPFDFEQQPDNTLLYTRESLSREEADRIVENLNGRYPRLNFETNDISNQNDPFAPLRLGIVGKVQV